MLYSLCHGASLDDVLKALAHGRIVYAPVEGADGQYHFARADAWEPGTHTLGAYRPVEPVKSLFFRPREFLGLLSESRPEPDLPERVVFGVKNCDLSALAIHDHVFLGEPFPEPHYAEAREKTLLVSCDCTGCLDVCFCPAVGEQPYPKAGFDINISQGAHACVIETGSEKGEAAIVTARAFLEPADEELFQQREQDRAAMYDRVANQATEEGLPPGLDLQAAVRDSVDSELWAGFAQDCVECGACNFVCCTCHCFLLNDGLTGQGAPARTRQWDSCLLKDFARTAGGGNARALRAHRLYNRFDKKFNFFPQVMGRYACDGCGRCTEVCIGKIDIRAVLKRAVDDTQPVHAG